MSQQSISMNRPLSTAQGIDRARASERPVHQAFWILRVGFTVAPILAGLDKFFHVLVNWDQYLAPTVNNLLGGNGHAFMLVAGVRRRWNPAITNPY